MTRLRDTQVIYGKHEDIGRHQQKPIHLYHLQVNSDIPLGLTERTGERGVEGGMGSRDHPPQGNLSSMVVGPAEPVGSGGADFEAGEVRRDREQYYSRSERFSERQGSSES